jgi:murein DD-endopeptidase MepM/ murein hydrolase activator NlpD
MYNVAVTKPRYPVLGLIALISLLWLASCAVPLGASGGGAGEWLSNSAQPSATAAGLLARRLVPSTPAPALQPTATRNATPDLESTPGAETASQGPAALFQDPPADPSTPLPELQICSPLQGILREDLPRLVSDGYSPPPRLRPDDRHHGVDFAYYHWKGGGPIAGTVVQSVLPGRVAMALEDTFPYGNVVIVEADLPNLPEDLLAALEIPEGQSLYLLYAHLKEESLQVQVNDRLAACQPMGKVGRTGNTEANHLHLETRMGPPGLTLTGMSAFTDTASDEEKRNYRLWRISGKYQHFDPMRLLLYGLDIAQPTSTPVAPKEKDG